MLHKFMNAITCFVMYIFFSNILPYVHSYVPSENIVLNCGSNTSELVQYDGRIWNGDIDSPYVPSYEEIINKSLTAKAPSNLQSIPEVPYMTARIFQSQFTYRFNVTSGPKFIRLHFYPFSYLNFNISKAFLSVTAGNFTLLHNFSVSLNVDYFNLAYLMKEFIVHVKGNSLELTFTPSSNDSDAYAFVNGIEVVSIPNGLYIGGDDSPIPLVGHDTKVVYIYNDSAMETLYRLNVGGEQILPKYDTGMFRNWDIDDGYIFGVDEIKPFNRSMKVLYTDHVPEYTAPDDVYRTSRSMTPYWAVNLNYNLTWFFEVDSGFLYLIRLHFCDVSYAITRVNEVVFSVFLNNQTAEEEFDPFAISGRPGVAIYRDYVVLVPKDSDAKQDLWLDLHPYKYSKPQFYRSFLNGVEIFKLSSVDKKNLAGLNPSEKKIGSSATATPHVVEKVKSSKKLKFILIGCGLGVVAIPILLCLVLLKFKVIKPRRIMSCCVLSPNQTEKEKKSSSFCCQFSLKEIKVATNDFNEALLIGTGGFGTVYKGSFDDGASFVAIKQIHLLSRVRHNNLVSLLGYCNEDDEMILVYDFMSNGSLYDHLHSKQKDQQQPHLSWIQRLEICIGVARGLHYLHTGTKHTIIHRDIKTTNILLDHNWIAKISDFGLSKESYTSLGTTVVKGSTGYLDPEYYQRCMLTEKSDLYSLGVVLLEVLSARQALSPCDDDDDDEHLNLAEWAKFCFENGNVEEIVDPNLEGNIVKECLELYLGIAMKCLAERGVERPSTGDVLQNLFMALQIQKNGVNVQNDLQDYSDLTLGIEFSDIMMPVGR
ncbi:feronia receptor-like kinase [Medicago truncatula]|uniref:non-specific serine/threonine protein kinase n=1 Tax=Medicago truncatula TaxID=3880 RepID=G7JY51_MEDTR|nr:feronia receptor-like kinase [Medicago truncatula]